MGGGAATNGREFSGSGLVFLWGPSPPVAGNAAPTSGHRVESLFKERVFLRTRPSPLLPEQTRGNQADHVDFARDRKSTRLNSSHGYISYAVFCLKKKTHRPRLGRGFRRVVL